MIIITIVRHGESTDNLKACWAGASDAPLSSHGMNQAAALGASLKTYRIDQMFASNLLRATWTAQQIHRQQPEPKPPLTLSPLLQEQNFGQAERQPFARSEEGKGYFRRPGRDFKFPGGESLNDVRARADQAIAKFIEPILKSSKGKTREQAPHVFVVAHGIFNAQFLAAFLARRAPSADPIQWSGSGMVNTAWTRIEVGYEDESEPGRTTTVAGTADEQTRQTSNPSAVPASAPSLNRPAGGLPNLNVKILCTNVSTHLDGLKRQGGGIGSSAYDSTQRGIRDFFSGA